MNLVVLSFWKRFVYLLIIGSTLYLISFVHGSIARSQKGRIPL